MTAVSPNEKRIAESLADPTVPGRRLAGVDRSQLTAEQRSRLVFTDPYDNGRRERQSRDGASATIELQLGAVRRRVPTSTREQRDEIVRLVEEGRASFVRERPSWFVPSGRFRVQEWPVVQPVPSVSGPDHMAAERALLRSAARAQAEHAAKHGSPAGPGSSSRFKYRPPTAG